MTNRQTDRWTEMMAGEGWREEGGISSGYHTKGVAAFGYLPFTHAAKEAHILSHRQTDRHPATETQRDREKKRSHALIRDDDRHQG